MRTLVWFRGKDLRVADHAPLRDAAAAGEVVPLFVLDPYFFAPRRARALRHHMQFLLESLAGLQDSLRRPGSELLLAEGRQRDRVDLHGTSRLSVDLKFGTLSVRSVWSALEGALGSRAASTFLNETTAAAKPTTCAT
jgi:deoxyribodipyrimidine photolyase